MSQLVIDIDWDTAPEDAMCVGLDHEGLFWYSDIPELVEGSDSAFSTSNVISTVSVVKPVYIVRDTTWCIIGAGIIKNRITGEIITCNSVELARTLLVLLNKECD
jgi:hypothetical protein